MNFADFACVLMHKLNEEWTLADIHFASYALHPWKRQMKLIKPEEREAAKAYLAAAVKIYFGIGQAVEIFVRKKLSGTFKKLVKHIVIFCRIFAEFLLGTIFSIFVYS